MAFGTAARPAWTVACSPLPMVARVMRVQNGQVRVLLSCAASHPRHPALHLETRSPRQQLDAVSFLACYHHLPSERLLSLLFGSEFASAGKRRRLRWSSLCRVRVCHCPTADQLLCQPATTVMLGGMCCVWSFKSHCSPAVAPTVRWRGCHQRSVFVCCLTCPMFDLSHVNCYFACTR